MDLLDHIPQAVVVFDARLRVLHANPPARQMLGEGEVLTDLLAQGCPPGCGQDWPAALTAVMSEGRPRRFGPLPWEACGRRRLVAVDCQRLGRRPDGLEVGMISFVDVTREQELEEQVAALERMAAVGKLGARVAHELGNLLDGTLRYANLAARVLPENDPDGLNRYLVPLRKGLQRMRAISRELLQSSRSAQSSGGVTRLGEIMDEAIQAFESHFSKANITLVCSLQDHPLPGTTATLLFQVCCNIIKNAVEAMPCGGKLTISSQVCNTELIVNFEDSGPGLPHDPERIFEPFFTTKANGHGTGLGLAICRDFVERFGGVIHAGNRPQGGAVFVIRIPLKEPS